MGKLTLLNVLLQSQVFFLLLVTILDATDKVKVNWKIKKKKKERKKEGRSDFWYSETEGSIDG